MPVPLVVMSWLMAGAVARSSAPQPARVSAFHVSWEAGALAASRPPLPAFTFDPAGTLAGRLLLPASGEMVDADPTTQTSPPPRAFQYSHAYEVRARIHKDASFAMLPLFVAEAIVGQRMFNNPARATGGMRGLHRGFAIGIAGLFAVNSVTGTMNLLESRKDPNAGLRRVIHGVLMLVADGGFLATAWTRPNGRTAAGLSIYDAKKNQHMALAYASISVATVGYLMMLFK